MGRRGRRQVLQLDDVSSSHQPRRYGFQPPHAEERRNQSASNPLLNLVGHYNSDSDEEDEEKDADDVPERQELSGAPSMPAPPQVDSSVTRKSQVAVEGSLDSEVASFLAEIESISTEPSEGQGDGSERGVDSTQSEKADLGFMIKPAASASSSGKADDYQKTSKSASSSAYKSMFVKGASEFVRQEDEEKDSDGQKDEDEELPEEPLSEWQTVQDEATQYYYYWNVSTNEVTWEIPPGYTQFLLLYKEYEERLAKIPEDKRQRLKEKAERQKQEKSNTGTSAEDQAPVSSSIHSSNGAKDSGYHKSTEHKSGKSSRHSKHSEVNGTSDHVSSSREKKRERKEYGPVLPSAENQDSEKEEVADSKKKDTVSEGEAESSASLASSAHSTASQVDSRSEAASLPTDPSKTHHSQQEPDLVAPDADLPSADAIIKEVLVSSEWDTGFLPQITGDKKSCEVESSAPEAGQGINPTKPAEPEEEDEDDDFDMDFDDIDDLDRALEKALEKKLEKKKAELSKLEEEKPLLLPLVEEPIRPSSPQLAEAKASTSSHSSEQENHLAVEHKEDLDFPASLPQQMKEEVTNGSEKEKETDERKISPSQSQTTKRSAEDVTKSDQELHSKKARLVAYDEPESDEDGSDTGKKSPPQEKAVKVLSDDMSSVLPTPPPERADDLTELQSMADTALDKLSFLEVTSDGLTPLQFTLIQLQTRLKDWHEGGLNAEYFFQRLSEVNGMLEQYEMAAVPPGWACHWDRNFRRYFYTHNVTGQSQWDYPHNQDGEAGSTDKEEPLAKKKQKSSRKGGKVKGKAVSEEEDTEQSGVAAESEVAEDLDGVAMVEDDDVQSEVPGDTEADVKSSTGSTASQKEETTQSAYQTLFPGEPLPPGTELLFGLPPPPPPPFPPPDTATAAAAEDNYICDDDSSLENGKEQEDRMEEKRERFEPEDMEVSQSGDSWVGTALDSLEPTPDPGVIAKPPQLRFPSAAAWLPGVSASTNHDAGPEPSSASVMVAPSVLSVLPQQQPDVSSSTSFALTGNSVSSNPCSPKPEEGSHSQGSPLPAADTTAGAEQKHEKHKKKKKEKLGSGGLALKKKGVSSLVQKWQKVKREVEQEERANEQRQLAIRQQLQEWKKENS